MPKATAQIDPQGAPSSRQRLVAAAAELFADGGWQAVTTRAAAERAGMNQGLVHYHFDSVDALRREALHALIGGMKDASLDNVTRTDSLAGALAEMAVAIEQLDVTSGRSGGLLDAISHAAGSADADSADLARTSCTASRFERADAVSPSHIAAGVASMGDSFRSVVTIDGATRFVPGPHRHEGPSVVREVRYDRASNAYKYTTPNIPMPN